MVVQPYKKIIVERITLYVTLFGRMSLQFGITISIWYFGGDVSQNFVIDTKLVS